MGRTLRSCCHCREKMRVAKAQLELGLPELWGTRKRYFLNEIMAIAAAKIPLAHSRMRMVTSQTGQGQGSGV